MGELSRCPGCGALLPEVDGPTHRYIGASPACWAVFTALGAGEPPVAPTRLSPLLLDAYCAQHPGIPSNQSVQSVAVHLLALYGVLERGRSPSDAIELRTRPLRERTSPKRGRFVWLAPPDLSGAPGVADLAAAPDPAARAELLGRLVRAVWGAWAPAHGATVADWYERYVLPERL